jgi:alanyl-tRNA synthetase
MTERLYYTDPYLREFDATLVDTVSHEGSTALVLDRTAFYPTSGGQPADAGAFHDVRVLDVIDADDGRILHVVDRAPSTTALHGTIDWTRRFDHMQQHTGQHVLSAAFDRLFGVRTESFHLGAQSSTIDLAREMSTAEISRAEDESNRVVWDDRPVTIRFVEAEEARRLGLRKESTRQGTIRLIDVTEFDLSACGGTHVARTGAIGIIAIAAAERFRGGSRVTFLCGSRALSGFRTLRDAVSGSVRVLSVAPSELPSAIERLQADAKELRRHLKGYQEQAAASRADALAAAAETAGQVRFVAASLDGWDANGLKLIASRIVEQPGFVVVLISEPAPSALVVARSKDVDVDAGGVLKTIVSRFGGKGGGRPELAQGGGVAAPGSAIFACARETIGSARTT